MFEISAKAYCIDHQATGGPTAQQPNGNDKQLKVLLRDIVQHLTVNNGNQAMVRTLHGAMVELAKPDGILSVTSMNQLIHSPTFSTTAGDVSVVFHNVFPLLQEMNR